MPIVAPASEANGGFVQTLSQGGMAQINQANIPNPAPASIAASSSWDSGLIRSDGWRYLSVGVTMSTAGSLVITRYVDVAGAIARPASTTSIVAATPLLVDIGSDLKPFQAFRVVVNNTALTAGAVSGFTLLMSAG